MPLIYGEGGKKAFLRLQEEIVKTCDDHTLFLWDPLPYFDESSVPYDRNRSEMGGRGAACLNLAPASSGRIWRPGWLIQYPEQWTPRGLMADHPSSFSSPRTSEPLGLLHEGELPQVTSRGLQLGLFLKRVNIHDYPPLKYYMDLIGAVRLALDQRAAGYIPNEDLSQFQLNGAEWSNLDTYLAALDCTPPDDAGEDDTSRHPVAIDRDIAPSFSSSRFPACREQNSFARPTAVSPSP